MSLQKAADVAISSTALGSGVAVWLGWIQGVAATVAAVGGAVLVLAQLYVFFRRNGKRD
jgi:uncharacterized MnhB-related membrane protein